MADGRQGVTFARAALTKNQEIVAVLDPVNDGTPRSWRRMLADPRWQKLAAAAAHCCGQLSGLPFR
jgi:hypothetical protein